ncbi:Aste57867_24737 [Aphanomyces stellatus]|uniref:Aste57867_24737 protein n=1 Tax=Aphanomyces stellatus TaxID=120398 RepID=A0A485LTB0_9STRA|nr:hypothetical protein As57867_024659 [Aphanomyces stellatus]VFU01373.1 Aste57867_24737 [Aphanomyces stellatus]
MNLRLTLALALSSVTMVQAQATCSLTPDVVYPGNNIGQTQQANPSDCCADCQNTPGCLLYRWTNGVCYLKNAQSATPAQDAGSFTGFVQAQPPPTTSKASPKTAAPTPKPTAKPITKPVTTTAPIPTCARVRKSWEAMTATEKDTYLSAVALAMDNGMYQKFVWVHQEQMSANEAHNTCVFLFWHRKFMLAYENMLRSLGDRYKCVTLPYWDYVQDYSSMQSPQSPTSRCRNIEACSKTAREIGGSTQGSPSSADFFGYQFQQNTCVNTSPLNHMCVRPNSGSCEKCVPRGDWTTLPLIPGMGIASIRPNLLNSGSEVAKMSKAIERSPHDVVHGASMVS